MAMSSWCCRYGARAVDVGGSFRKHPSRSPLVLDDRRHLLHAEVEVSQNPLRTRHAGRTSCTQCQADALATVGDLHCSAIVQYAAPTATDACPGDFWVEVTSAAGADLYLGAYEVSGLVGTECSGSSILVEAVWASGWASVSSAGQVNDNANGCVFPDEVQVAAQHLTEPLRVRVTASPGSSFDPALTVRRGTQCELPIP
jgi:hypothetical protein